MRRYDNGRHILFDDLREIVRLQGWGLVRPRFKQLIDRLDSQNGGDQTELNAFFTVLPSRGLLSPDSEGPSNQQVIDYIREDLECGRSEVLRHFYISRKRAKRLVASARCPVVQVANDCGFWVIFWMVLLVWFGTLC